MKKSVLVFLSIACLVSGIVSAAERFYGKITSIDQSQKQITVHNTRQQVDQNFQWDDQTGVMFNKKSITPTELKIGQSLMVSYVTENDLNKARRIMVRTPFKKSVQ